MIINILLINSMTVNGHAVISSPMNRAFGQVLFTGLATCSVIIYRNATTSVAPIMVVAGGLILRFVIVYAGQFSLWTIAGQ